MRFLGWYLKTCRSPSIQMRTCCSRGKAFVVALLFGVVCFHDCHCTLLSKSKVTLCIQDSDSDPYNVVGGKKCEKKLVVSKAVRPEQKPTDLLYVNVSTVEDEVDHDHARLYNPFIVTITSSPMHIVYPYYLVGTVNNKPYETSKREYWCQDGGAVEDDSDFSCEVLRDESTGERVWDSQGFCCRCTYEEDLKHSQGGRYHRGQAVCGNMFNIPILSWLFKNDDRQSAHCMKYSNLWYDVHKIGLYKIWFKIFIKAYDLVQEEKDGKPHQKLVDGGQITLSNFKTSGHGIHGRILASLVGMFQPDTQFYSLTERYLLIPNPLSSVRWDRHPQTKGGSKDYLIVPRTDVVLNNPSGSCDKIGVTFTAFRNQGAHDGQGTGCTRKMGSCLANQIKDFFEKDLRARQSGKTPQYFPERYGEVVGTGKFDGTGEFALIYKVPKTGPNIHVNLEISADDIILIYNRATGIIVKALATDFESLSQDGRLNVIAQNTGLVTAEFYVTVEYCTRGILRAPESQASINPQSVHTFTIDLRTVVHESSKFMCTVHLRDARHHFLDAANVTFETTKACICLQTCSCACTGTADTETCVLKGFTDPDDENRLENVKLTKNKLTALERFFEGLNNSLDAVVDLFAMPSLHRAIQIYILLSLLFGFLKARLGIQPGGAPIAYFGWWWDQPVGQETIVDSKGFEVVGMYNKDGELIDPSTGEVLKSEKLLLFIGNIFFFLLLVCILGVRAARIYNELQRRTEMTVSLSSVALAGTTVYRNFTEFANADKYLKNPGESFSIAGKLQRVKVHYKFVVVDHLQIIEVTDDAILLLTPAEEFDASVFTKTFTEQQALKEITLEPLYMCLNEEPLFDYYSDDDEPVTPEESNSELVPIPSEGDSSADEYAPLPPPPDYLLQGLDTPYSISGYEKPVELRDDILKLEALDHS